MAIPSDLIERIGGESFAADARRTESLDDPERILLVERGYLDIFAAEFQGAEAVSRRPFATRVPAGSVAFGAPRVKLGERSFGFLAVPARNAKLVEGRRAGLDAEGSLDLGLISLIDDWVCRLSELFAGTKAVPRGAMLLEADPEVPYPARSALSAHHLDVVWVSADRPVRLMGSAGLTVEAGDPVPLSERIWLVTGEDETLVSAVHTPAALLAGALWPALDRFNALALLHSAAARREDAEAAGEVHEEVREAHRKAGRKARRALESVLSTPAESPAAAGGGTAAEAAMRILAASVGADLRSRPGAGEKNGDPLEAYEALARGSPARTRRIKLAPGWWKRDGPSFAGVAADDGRPIAVLSNGRGRFRAVDPATERAFRVGRREAAGIASDGVMLYAPFPDRVRGVGAALAHAVASVTGDIRAVLLMSLLGGLVGLATPILTGHLLATIIPRSDIPLWIAGLAAMVLCALGAATFQIVQSFALIRIEGRLDERLHGALWSRVLSLPAGFFRRYAAGDLANRLRGLTAIRTMASGAAVRTIVSGLFSLSGFAILLYYSMRLAFVAGAMVLGLFLVSMVLGRLQMRHHREALRAQGVIEALMYQMISGLAKLRVANAEPYALERWAGLFARQRSATLSARRWAAAQAAFNGLFTPLASAVLLAVIWVFLLAAEEPSGFGLAAFLVAFSAFGQLAAAVTGLIGAATTVIAMAPLFERVKPLLEAATETTRGRTDPGDLTGEIELREVRFRYLPDGEDVLKSVSLRIRPGDYVAIVGPSGSGKSTIFRLLFGFERPDAGSVLFDGHDLLNLDPEAVRRHLGVVLQNSQVAADSILNNVAGPSRLGAGEIWEAVRAAGLEDDIRAMPMGLHTMLHEGGGGLSGGQRQRLLIARALARKPRILLLDEATSALDNHTQSVVQESLGKLSITRIVIAHRLSTVRGVDRIHVLDRGRIVESGRYEDLIRSDGLFAELARRQLT